jgi:hydroxyacylglutathione hydrolase
MGFGWGSSNQYTCFRLELTSNRITVMKQSVKRIIVAAVSTIGLIVVLLGVLLFVAYSETGKMSPVETGQVAPNVFAVKDGLVNLYLMDFGDGYVAFDAGSDREVILEEMASLSIQPDEVKAVFLTHSDFDHTAALEEFAQATVFLPELEEQMIDGRKNRLFIVGNDLEREYSLVKDDQVIGIGGLEIRGIATPGHTPGSMCFLVNGTYLFIGDSASLKDGRIGLFNGLFNMDGETQETSLRELASLDTPTHVFTMHYGVSDNYQAAFADFR